MKANEVTQKYVEEKEFYFPPDPCSKNSTIGSKTIKNASGYNLKEFFIGSVGTLGIITKVWLKVIPYPTFNQTLIAAMPDIDEAAEAVSEIMATGIDITALEMFDRKGIAYSERAYEAEFPSQKGSNCLQIIVDGTEQSSIDKRIAIIKEIVKKHEALEFLNLNKEETTRAWMLRDKILGVSLALVRMSV